MQRRMGRGSIMRVRVGCPASSSYFLRFTALGATTGARTLQQMPCSMRLPSAAAHGIAALALNLPPVRAVGIAVAAFGSLLDRGNSSVADLAIETKQLTEHLQS